MNRLVYFEVGDVVQLKSGGPKMTVVEVVIGMGAYCEWFDENNKLQPRKLFDEQTLKQVK